MLHRQRTILRMLRENDGQATHLELTKWAFLLTMETSVCDATSFYQFVPYRYGPFSFGLFRDMASMARDGLVIDRPGSRWQLSSSGTREARTLNPIFAIPARDIVKRHASKSASKLVDYVYERYPWYTVNSTIKQLLPRPVANIAIHTAGYEGLQVDGFLNGLLRTGISQVIDVRRNPIARRYGFHKSTLTGLCDKLGLTYSHYPTLGICSSERRNLDAPGARTELFSRYQSTTLVEEVDTIKEVAKAIARRPSVLICMESEACECHRSHLANRIAKETGLTISHHRFS